MKFLLWLLVAILLVAHQDFWYWNDDTLVFGIFPIGLFYHACLSVVTSIFWLFACTFAWPQDLEEDFEGEQSEPVLKEVN